LRRWEKEEWAHSCTARWRWQAPGVNTFNRYVGSLLVVLILGHVFS
jgi:hypothetical protein